MELNKKTVSQWNNQLNNNNNEKLLQNIITKNSITKLYTNRDVHQKYQHIFSNKVTPFAKATNQASSGRCWLFAGLNVIRRQMMEKYKLKDFEFSQNYLFFWDKLERFNYNLECIIETKNETLNSQLVQHLLTDPTCDGGQWDMVVNLIEKYGLVPKCVYNESYHSSNSDELNSILTKLFRNNAKILRESTNPRELKNNMVKEAYNILCKFLGTPPEIFDWIYEPYKLSDSTKESKESKESNIPPVIIKNLTPLSFYKEYVDFNCDDYVCLINDPRKEHPYNKMYTVKYLGNIVEGHKVRYLNLDINTMKQLVLNNIKNNTPVWFGCDVGKSLHNTECAMDFELTHHLQLLNIELSLTKEDRLNFKESLMTHAMVITGANIQKNVSSITNTENETVDIWQIENSWSDKGPLQGYYTMTDKWFDEYVYEIVVHKKYLTPEQQELYKTGIENYTVLDTWDPMGSLA